MSGQQARQSGHGRAERLNAILDRISGMGSVAVSEMAEELGVSEATVRRDLDHLSDQQLVARTHGGALAHHAEVGTRRRRNAVLPQHTAVAELLAARCASAHAVGITGESLGELIAGHLAGRRLAVLTNALDVAARLKTADGVDLVVTGGTRRAGTSLLVGHLAEQAAASYQVDVAVVVCEGVTETSLSVADSAVAGVAGQIIARARSVVVACPPEGIGVARFASVGSTSDVAEVVTWLPDEDDSLNREALDAVADAGPLVTVVEAK
ncbi:DeoR/GlpR family DNA-binding transcription regulator [Streptomyces luteolus]|uniref:DeoR/GlpR family DNA-binding transcription regulator n=1 Tax=Streptomyces luteolus TaxID=3043615 RepID=A0ABT6ST02_9ACTN|nr:DeoR/GlpR family DNA-binding transcription regulator [Streptomyces sp. B-S-A12]MDI3418738.1 DeoR/GlpR family DNA-binding transcription regulator [Streptomyces sp. B-S-A12]